MSCIFTVTFYKLISLYCNITSYSTGIYNIYFFNVDTGNLNQPSIKSLASAINWWHFDSFFFIIVNLP